MRWKFLALALTLAIIFPAVAAAQDQSNPQSGQPSNQSPSATEPETPPTRIRLNGSVVAAKITKMVAPKYPYSAKRASICGTIVLHAIIGKDGSINELKYLSGPPLLIKAAMDAVSKWRYSPTIFQGQPREVDCTIKVVFELKGCKPPEASAPPLPHDAPVQQSEPQM